MNMLFQKNITIVEYSFTECGNYTEENGRFFLHARCGEKDFYCERNGTDSMYLAAESYCDILNVMLCSDRS
jgi:hypothetical protein